MGIKIKLIMAVFLLVILSVYPSISLSAGGADEFKAEGLTEPVKKGDRDYSVKVTFPNEDFYMEFSPPRATYYTPEGIGFSNEWGETASIETEHPGWGEVLFDRNAVMWIEKQSPARKVVRFRGVLKTPEGEILHTYVDSGSPY
ncbi:MAG: hypothetical protein ACYSWP_24020, partial [Planctomycetota bacterium]